MLTTYPSLLQTAWGSEAPREDWNGNRSPSPRAGGNTPPRREPERSRSPAPRREEHRGRCVCTVISKMALLEELTTILQTPWRRWRAESRKQLACIWCELEDDGERS